MKVADLTTKLRKMNGSHYEGCGSPYERRKMNGSHYESCGSQYETS